MKQISRTAIATVQDRPREQWHEAGRSPVSWFTLFSSDITPTDSMTAGIAEIPPGDGTPYLHRHAQPELYFIVEGTGILTVDGVETTVTPGTAVFIPGDAEHGLRNESDSTVKLLYVFPTDSFAEVVYRFPD